MPKYSVQIPITGYVIVEVEAADEKEAIQKAFESDELSKTDIEEWETHEHVCEGNVFHGSVNDASAELIKD